MESVMFSGSYTNVASEAQHFQKKVAGSCQNPELELSDFCLKGSLKK